MSAKTKPYQRRGTAPSGGKQGEQERNFVCYRGSMRGEVRRGRAAIRGKPRKPKIANPDDPPTEAQLRWIASLAETIAELEGDTRLVAKPRSKEEARKFSVELVRWQDAVERGYATRFPRCFGC
jgi:hypothetical protein